MSQKLKASEKSSRAIREVSGHSVVQSAEEIIGNRVRFIRTSYLRGNRRKKCFCSFKSQDFSPERFVE